LQEVVMQVEELVEVVLPGKVEPEGLYLRHGAVPSVGPGRVLIRMEATGVSFAEQQMRRGRYYDQPPFPFVPGYDLVGTVVSTGDDVEPELAGTRVAALVKVGGWASHVLVDAADVVPVPDGTTAADAETVLVNGITAWQMLHRKARLRTGKTASDRHPAAAGPHRRGPAAGRVWRCRRKDRPASLNSHHHPHHGSQCSRVGVRSPTSFRRPVTAVAGPPRVAGLPPQSLVFDPDSSVDTGLRRLLRCRCGYSSDVSLFRIREAADLLGVSDDTVRRWAESGRFETVTDGSGRLSIEGAVLARFATELAASAERPEAAPVVSESARNRFVGLVTRVVRDTVMAQVEIQAGRHRIVSLMSREAADELRLEPGVLAVAAVKSTNVVVEVPAHR